MEAGQRIGSYEVRALLGRGGMGAVFLAEHTVIGRKAAIKVLKAEFAGNPVLVRRFQNEARATNAIHHPGIVDVIDVGTLPGEVPYLVMEYLQGESLAHRLTNLGRFPVSQAVNIVCQTASAVGAAHEQGIVHRDLKPENLFLIPDPLQPARELVKVLDFGIAKLRAGLSPNTVDTRTGYLLGTPQYMSPEQCRGIHDEIDHRTDVYSLGVLLYEMVCGVTPFVSSGFGDVLLMHMTEAPVPPSTKNPLVPPAVEKVILRALAKKPEDRYATMRDLREALGEDLSGSAMTSVGFGKDAERKGAVGPGSSGGRTPPPSTILMEGARDADSLVATTPKVLGSTSVRPHPWRRTLMALGAGGVALVLLGLLAARRHDPDIAPATQPVTAGRPTPTTFTPLAAPPTPPAAAAAEEKPTARPTAPSAGTHKPAHKPTASGAGEAKAEGDRRKTPSGARAEKAPAGNARDEAAKKQTPRPQPPAGSKPHKGPVRVEQW